VFWPDRTLKREAKFVSYNIMLAYSIRTSICFITYHVLISLWAAVQIFWYINWSKRCLRLWMVIIISTLCW